jgi:hypothetical protein
MPADFSTLGKRARMQIAIPPLDIEVIRARSAARSARERLRRLVACAGAALGAAGAAAALASTAGGWHLWLFGNNVESTVQSLAMVREPMAADVRAIVQRAAFPIVLPDGLPAGFRVRGIAYSPVERPTLLTIQYGNPSDPWAIGVSLIETQALAADKILMPAGPAQAMRTQGYHFRVGRETVLVQGRHVSSAQAARIRAAMQRETPAQTAAAFNVLLSRIVVLQKVTPQVAEVAERIAPPGKNVVIGEWDLRGIPRLSVMDKPLRDSRTVYMTNIPQMHGEPDYRNSTLQWPKSIAIAPSGVRFVASAMRRSHVSPRCDCAVLLHDSKGTYTAWRIDQKTLKVMKLQQ